MRLSLVNVKRRAGRDGGPDEVSRRETLIDGDAFQIGRGLEFDIVIPDIDVDHHHATLRRDDGQLVMTSVGDAELRVGGRVEERVVLKVGEPVTLGNHTLTLEEPPEHADVALALEAVPVAEVGPRHREALAELLPSRRRIAWLLSIPVIALTLAWPLFEALNAESATEPGDVVRIVAIEKAPETVSHPTVAAWTSGPMSVAHALIGEDCGACHKKPFEMTRDNACLACHADTQRHVDAKEVGGATVAAFPIAGLDDIRCGTCHKEHEGGLAPVVEASAACTTCHADSGRMHGLVPEYPGSIRVASDFGSDHPPFRSSGAGEQDAQYVYDWVASGGSEGLKFPHDVHLTGRVLAPLPFSLETLTSGPPEGWAAFEAAGYEGTHYRSPEGRVFNAEGRAVLGCADCHKAEAGGKLMREVEMERDCSWCHQLKIDTLDYARDVPHANELETTATIRDYYRARALEGGIERRDAPALAQRPFGTQVLSTRREIEEAVAWAKAEADMHLERVFSDEGTEDPNTGLPAYDVGTGLCAYCHKTERQADNEREPFKVIPAKVRGVWMPKAIFDHGPHMAMKCGACHEATTSKESQDVLMPKLAVCRDCHVDEGGDSSASASCITCHGFHGNSEKDRNAPLSAAHMAEWQKLRVATERAAERKNE